MRPVWALMLAAVLTACGVAGEPVPPGSGIDPKKVENGDLIDPDDFFG